MEQEGGRQEAQQDYTNMSEETMMSSPFTAAELDTALTTLQLKTAQQDHK